MRSCGSSSAHLSCAYGHRVRNRQPDGGLTGLGSSPWIPHSYAVNGVSVSNFVPPSWFDPLAPATAQFDKLGQLHAAFSILKGGYVVYESAGKEQQKFGDEFPQWRREMKGGPLARTRRRLGQAAGF
jgi:hypothetical protein